MKKLLLFLLLAIPGACYGDSEVLWNYRIGSGVWSVDMAADGNYIAAGTFTSTSAGLGYGVYFFNKSGDLLWNYETTDVVWSVSMSDDGRYIAVGSKDKNLYLFDKSGSLLWKYKIDDTVWTVTISSNGDYIAAGSYDKNVYLFDKSGALHWKHKTDDIVLATSISSNGDYIAAGSYDNNVYLFDKSGALLWKYRTNNVVLATSISSNGDYIAAGSYDNNVYLFDKSGTLQFKYKTEDEVWDVDMSSDGSFISAASKDSNVYFLSTTGDLLGKYRTGGYVSSVSISNSGNNIAAGSYDNNVYLFKISLASKKELEIPELNVIKTVTRSSLRKGENTTVLIELKNTGEGIARNIEFEDIIPEGFVLVSGKLSQVTELAPGESKTFSYMMEALETKEQKEVLLPTLEVSFNDLEDNQYSATGHIVSITLLPKEKPAIGTGLKERLISAVPLISFFYILKLVFSAIFAALFLIAVLRRVKAMRKNRRKIDKTQVIMKIRKEVGADDSGHSHLPSGNRRREHARTSKVKSSSLQMKPGTGSTLKLKFGKPVYRKDTVNLLKMLKREVRK